MFEVAASGSLGFVAESASVWNVANVLSSMFIHRPGSS